MRSFFFAGAAALLLAGSANAQVTDPNMDCEAYLKLAATVGPTPKTGDAAMDKMAAEVDAKMNAYCKANPKAKAMEAAAKALGG